MNPQIAINKFQTMLKKAIEVREQALYAENPLFKLSMSVQDEEIARKEQALLKNLLSEFNKTFTVESLCVKCLKRADCTYSSDEIGECERYVEEKA